MFEELFAVIAPILICASIGVVWIRMGVAYPADFVSRAVMNIGAPCLIVSTVGRVPVDLVALGQVAEVAVLVLLMTLLVGTLVIRLLDLSIPTYLPPLLFPNNGNMGLPLCLFAFGETGLALALGYFLVLMLSHFTLGIFIVGSGQGDLRSRLKDLATQPVLYAMAIALYMLMTGWRFPRWLDNTVDLLGGFAIPLMMITLGVSLASLKMALWHRSLGLSVIRVLGGFGVAWLACEWMGLEGTVRGVVLLQAAMPSAVFNYLFAHRYQRSPEEVAGMVVMSTLLAFVCLPFLVTYVLTL